MPSVLRSPLWLNPTLVPTVPVGVDWTHPLANGLQTLWLFNGSAAFPMDLVQGLTATNNQASASFWPTPIIDVIGAGAFQPYGNANVYYLGSSDRIYSPNSTFGVARRLNESPSNNSLFGDGVVNTHVPYSGVVYWDFPSSGSRVSIPFAVTQDIETWLFSGGGAGRSIWRNSQRLYNNTTMTTQAAPSASNTFKLNAGAAIGQKQTFFLFASWSRQLPDNESRWWTAEPFAMLRPIQPRRTWSVASGPIRTRPRVMLIA